MPDDIGIPLNLVYGTAQDKGEPEHGTACTRLTEEPWLQSKSDISPQGTSGNRVRLAK